MHGTAPPQPTLPAITITTHLWHKVNIQEGVETHHSIYSMVSHQRYVKEHANLRALYSKPLKFYF